MTFLSWRDNYTVGIPQIDTEHQYIFRLINEFHDKCAGGDRDAKLLVMLNRLVAYAKQHFQHEESLMQEVGYPRLERHLGQHVELFSSIFALSERVAQEPGKADAEALRFLKTWMLDHILKDDMDIGDFLRRRAVATEKTIHDGAVDEKQTAVAAGNAVAAQSPIQ